MLRRYATIEKKAKPNQEYYIDFNFTGVFFQMYLTIWISQCFYLVNVPYAICQPLHARVKSSNSCVSIFLHFLRLNVIIITLYHQFKTNKYIYNFSKNILYPMWYEKSYCNQCISKHKMAWMEKTHDTAMYWQRRVPFKNIGTCFSGSCWSGRL